MKTILPRRYGDTEKHIEFYRIAKYRLDAPGAWKLSEIRAAGCMSVQISEKVISSVPPWFQPVLIRPGGKHLMLMGK